MAIVYSSVKGRTQKAKRGYAKGRMKRAKKTTSSMRGKR